MHLNLGPGAIVNQIADRDLCPGALEMAGRLVSQLSKPCFNAPAAVARTSRDQVARVSSGIAGLRVPLDDMPPIRGSDFGLYATEFHDCVGANGRYRKFRVVVLGEQVFLRHCVIADNWLLHAARRAAGTEDIERGMFAIFDREWAAPIVSDLSRDRLAP